jgi:hypothetical protein
MVFRALFELVLWCVSAWFVVRFAVKEISREEGDFSLTPSSTMLQMHFLAEAVWMSSSDCSR